MKKEVYDSLYAFEEKHWWYRVRRNMVHALLTDLLPHPNSKILDVGCGTGLLLKELQETYEAEGLDMSEDAVQYCKDRGICLVQQGEVVRLPYEENTFDTVLCLDVLEHVKDDEKAVSELYRVTKEGGNIIVFVPAFMFMWGSTDELSMHERRYNKKEIEKTVTEGGFKIKDSTYFNTFLFPLIALVRLSEKFMKRKVVDEYKLPHKIINSLLFGIFTAERFICSKVKLPFGVSAMVVGEKRAEKK